MVSVSTKRTLLETIDIKKSFMGKVAIENINLNLYEGECHVLVGENGAGKSTLMKILSGVYQEDEGKILLNGKEVDIPNPKAAQNLGISIIHQEFNLIPELTVGENIFLGRELTKGILLNDTSIYRKTKELIESIEVTINPRALVSELTVAEKQITEILKAVYVDSKIIIMDEPTASLSTNEVKKLFKIIRMFKEMGKGIIYISHHLEEFEEIADRISVLRDGSLVKEMGKGADVDKIVEHMVGRKIENLYPCKNKNFGDTLFRAHNISGIRGLSNINFTVKAGEIVGISGLMGSGQMDLARTLYGVSEMKSGYIEFNGKKHKKMSPKAALENGLAFVSEDRKDEGLIQMMSITFNITMSSLKSVLDKWGLLKIKNEVQVSKIYMDRLSIKANDPMQEVVFLSGGNQQKVVFGRVLFSNPDIIILCEPTRGVDVNAKVQIYKLINSLVHEKKGVILISSDLPEIIGLSNRVLVMNKGKIVHEVKEDKITQEEIMYYSTIGGSN